MADEKRITVTVFGGVKFVREPTAIPHFGKFREWRHESGVLADFKEIDWLDEIAERDARIAELERQLTEARHIHTRAMIDADAREAASIGQPAQPSEGDVVEDDA